MIWPQRKKIVIYVYQEIGDKLVGLAEDKIILFFRNLGTMKLSLSLLCTRWYSLAVRQTAEVARRKSPGKIPQVERCRKSWQVDRIPPRGVKIDSDYVTISWEVPTLIYLRV